MANLRILIADDSQFMRTAYKRILETQDNFEIVWEASDGEEALQKALELVPDVAILDVRMPKMDGIQAAHHILEQHPKTAIVVISAYDDITFVTELLKDGPEGKAYLLKNSLDDIGELLRVVEAVVDGQTVLDPAIVQKLARLQVRQSKSLMSRLTESEQSVMELMAEGYTDPEIAATIGLDEASVKTYSQSIYEKLGLSTEERLDHRPQAELALVNQGSAVPYTLEGRAKG